ncbi:MAG: recombinase family protein, partial [Candidatus Levybacteria bacterium]|nr:recombinase family protein [Candidatus Levybacteria bacterium]
MSYLTKETIEQTKNITFIVYLRKSSDDNRDTQVRSLPGQRMDVDEMIKKNNLKVIKPYLEESQTAFKKGRPRFNEMLQRLESGEAQGVIVWHPNRIARNYGDGGRFVQAMSEGHIKLVFTWAGGIYADDPRDKEYLMTEFTRATRDSDDKGVAVKRGNRTRFFEKKQWIGPAKIGYLNVYNPVTKEKEIKVDPERYPLVVKGIRLILSGAHTPMQVLHKINDEWAFRTRKTKRQGGRPLSKAGWYKLLADPYLYGLMIRREGETMGEHKPMLNKDEFERLQIILGRKGKPRIAKHEFAYKEVLKCGGCGGSVTAEERWQIICPQCKTKFHRAKNTDKCKECGILIEEMKNPKILHYVHYHCTKRAHPDCTQGSIPLKVLEKQIDEELSKFEIKEEFRDWAIQYLNELNDKEASERNVSQNNAKETHRDVVKKLDNLTKMFISPQNVDKDVLTEEEYLAQRKSLLSEKESLVRLVKEIDKQQDQWHELSVKTFNFACYARYWFDHGDLKEKTEILGALGSNLTIKDKTLRVDGQSPFLIISDGLRRIEGMSGMFEPAKKPDLARQSASLEALRQSWLRSLDSNQNKRIQSPLSY